ncbi:6-phosphogluconolactonase [Candidatus Regiella insecticola]|uniref:6-phosphogluconolactonase n=1 Tax=Candidatus Regiella insecticola TaxID=138073 RepID=A0A6L2ZQT3_9ENTR|nr:6-phosphogluconolactonase [Candidatus Regiella insecticola]GFN46879.1 6-phosphogluconolactonase [Candidatus Regiella insecticola]
MKQIVYVASPNSEQIDVWQLDSCGELTWLQTEKVKGQVQPMVINPNKTHLYVGVRPDFAIITYHIAADGRLQPLARAALPAGPTHISTDLAGNFLFSASYSGNCVSVSPIDKNGMVKDWTQQLNNLMTPHSVNRDPTNQLLLVPCLTEDKIKLFNLTPDGELTPHFQKELITAKGAGPRHMAFHPKHPVSYCVNELNSTVDVYQYSDDAKQYTLLQTINALPANFSGTCWAADIHITPDGRYLYISDRTTSLLAIFTVSNDGTVITLIGHQLTEAQPRGFNIDSNGNFLIAAGQQSDHIVVYRIDQSCGKLIQLARHAAGKGAMWVSILAIEK